ncbi:PucR family transcriptional regulator [Saccharopolyspora hattusasensis]|uniref:PucR family transcriptional regulator n=1 Tax=Saccharopolyspora hattusasensis TaxID=1128679 RepID=UPI003D958AB6
MILTVRDVLALPVVAAGRPRVVAGRTLLDRPIRWVHISESTDLTDLLEGGELVLSTGLPLTGGPAAVSDYLTMLGTQQVAGLVVELGTHLRDVPADLERVAEAAGVPVVVLEAEIRFVEVTEQVHRRIVAEQYDEVSFARTTHEVFTSLNMARASSTDIVTRASHILNAPLVLEDLNRHVLAHCAAGESTSQLLDQWAERSRMHDSPSAAKTSGWSAVRVGVGTERWGRLVLPVEAANEPRAKMVLERAAQSLQLHRMLQQERDALVVHALGGLLDDMLSGRINDETEALVRANALGLKTNKYYVPIVIRVPQRPDAHPLTQGEIDRRLLTTLRQAISETGHTAIVSIRREGTVSAVMSCAEPDNALHQVCAGLDIRLSQRDGTNAWVAGTAPHAATLLAAAQEISEAEHVADVGVTMPEVNRLYRFTDVRLRGLIALIRNDHHVQAFAETELGRLLEHDARNNDDLLSLLRTYLDCGGSKTHTARTTGLSRPTLYTRLQTIERILNIPLDSAESRTSLHTALMILGAS